MQVPEHNTIRNSQGPVDGKCIVDGAGQAPALFILVQKNIDRVLCQEIQDSLLRQKIMGHFQPDPRFLDQLTTGFDQGPRPAAIAVTKIGGGNIEADNGLVKFLLHDPDNIFETLVGGGEPEASDNRDLRQRGMIGIGRDQPPGLKNNRVFQQ